MTDPEQYARYRQDSDLLAQLGRHLAAEVERITVRLPQALADAAVAAWDRDELGDNYGETADQARLRGHAADFALIGLVIHERGVREGGDVVVDLPVDLVGAAVRVGQGD